MNMAIRMDIDYDGLFLICEALVGAHCYEYGSQASYALAMERRLSLGPRIFRALLKQPTPARIAVTDTEARLIEFCLKEYPMGTDEQRTARGIMGQIQPKLLTT